MPDKGTMHGSEAGLVRMGSSGPKVILTTAGASGDSGPTCQEAKFWTKWAFSLAGTFTGYSVMIYGTMDPATAVGNGSNWFEIPAEAVQSGTGVEANPLTSNVQSLSYDRPLLAVRALASGPSATGSVQVLVMAVP